MFFALLAEGLFGFWNFYHIFDEIKGQK